MLAFKQEPPVFIYSAYHPTFLLPFFFLLFFFECVFDDAWLRGYLSGILYLFACYILMIYSMIPIWEKSTPLTVPTLISPTKLRLVL